MDQYCISSTSTYFEYPKTIWNEKESCPGTRGVLGRTIDCDDPIYDRILQGSYHGNGFAGNTDMGFIITRDFAQRYCRTEEPSHVMITMEALRGTTEAGTVIIPVPVRAIVDRLPSQASFLSTQRFIQQYRMRRLDPRITRNIYLFCAGTEEHSEEIADRIVTHLGSNNETGYNRYEFEDPSVDAYDSSWIDGYLISLIIKNREEGFDFDNIYEIGQYIVNSPEFSRYNLVQVYRDTLATTTPPPRYNRLSVNFSELDNVTALSDTLRSRYNVIIAMSSIISKENFSIVQMVALNLSIGVFVLSCLGVAVFAFSIVVQHIKSNRVYIGIYSAFGISGKTFRHLYTAMIRKFILIHIAIGIVSAAILLVTINFILGFSRDLFILTYLNWIHIAWLLLLFIAILGIGWYVAKERSEHYLKKCPSDLMNDRG